MDNISLGICFRCNKVFPLYYQRKDEEEGLFCPKCLRFLYKKLEEWELEKSNKGESDGK